MTPQIFNELMGKNIEFSRKARRLTQQELADRAFISRQSISNIEKGKSSKYLLSVIWALGLDEQVLRVISPEKDELGRSLAFGSLPQRVGKKRSNDSDEF